MNEIISQHSDEEKDFPRATFSQSMIYRIFKEFKASDLIDTKSIVIKNRNQNLYIINEKGKNRLERHKKVITNFAPLHVDLDKFTANFLAGKISPLDVLPKNLPKDQVLKFLKSIRNHLENALTKVNKKIQELEGKTD